MKQLTTVTTWDANAMNSGDDWLLYISLKVSFRLNLKCMLPSSRVGGSVFVPSVVGATVVDTSEV